MQIIHHLLEFFFLFLLRFLSICKLNLKKITKNTVCHQWTSKLIFFLYSHIFERTEIFEFPFYANELEWIYTCWKSKKCFQAKAYLLIQQYSIKCGKELHFPLNDLFLSFGNIWFLRAPTIVNADWNKRICFFFAFWTMLIRSFFAREIQICNSFKRINSTELFQFPCQIEINCF